MIFGKSNLEIKVGIFVFAALVILAVFVYKIGDFKIPSLHINWILRFNFINGVKIRFSSAVCRRRCG